MNKKEKARLASHQAEELRKAADDERLNSQVEEAARQERELIILEEKVKKDRVEQSIRDRQLESTTCVMKEHWEKVSRFELEVREKEKWEQYLKCDGLPDPASVPEMNCYLFAWRLELEACSIERVVARTPEVIEILKALTQLIDYPLDNLPGRVDEWKDLRNAIRKEQQLHMDEATYQLLREMKDIFELTDLNTMRFDTRSPHFIFYMWGLLPLPIPDKASRNNMGHTSECEFPDLSISIHMPQPLADKYLAIRAIWLKYDHLSDLCRSFDPPAIPSESLTNAEEIALKKNLTYNGALHEVNLRRYMILGGVFHLNLLSLPPQPRQLFRKFVLTNLDAPPRLTQEPFYECYVPPPPPEAGVRRLPEEIELELKQQEAALDKLCLITIALPTNVLWFEPPIVVGWDSEKGYWSTEDCHDLKFSEEKQTVQFRTGRLGPFGLAVYRYTNLPYQGWEIKPDHKTGGVSISISATIAVVEFVVLEEQVCMSLLQNGGSAALQELIDVFMRPEKLVRLLIEGGVNIFPSHDAFCYVEGVTSKHSPCEDHLYQCMSLCGTAYNFAWSRWNLLAGYRSMVLQIREYLDRKDLPPYSMLHVTPQRTLIVDCTEVGQTFSEEGVEGMEFYADLHHLVQEHCDEITKQKINEQSFKTTDTVYKMLTRIKPLSFS